MYYTITIIVTMIITTDFLGCFPLPASLRFYDASGG